MSLGSTRNPSKYFTGILPLFWKMIALPLEYNSTVSSESHVLGGLIHLGSLRAEHRELHRGPLVFTHFVCAGSLGSRGLPERSRCPTSLAAAFRGREPGNASEGGGFLTCEPWDSFTVQKSF